jgi:hypothetical protein
MINKIIQIICISCLLISCTAKKSAISVTEATTKVTKSELVEKHYAIPTEFNTLNIRSSVKYKDNKLDQSVNADIRIEKDKQILIIVRFLGVPFVKALITPNRVSYYDSFNGQYFDGNYDILSNWLGIDLDYNNVQNIFLGKSIYNLRDINFLTALDNGFHKIKYKTNDGLINESFFEDYNYLLMKTIIKQPSENRTVVLDYDGYNNSNNIYLPSTIKIVANQQDAVRIDIKYNSVSVNDNVSFKYEIPNGYKQIVIKED